MIRTRAGLFAATLSHAVGLATADGVLFGESAAAAPSHRGGPAQSAPTAKATAGLSSANLLHVEGRVTRVGAAECGASGVLVRLCLDVCGVEETEGAPLPLAVRCLLTARGVRAAQAATGEAEAAAACREWAARRYANQRVIVSGSLRYRRAADGGEGQGEGQGQGSQRGLVVPLVSVSDDGLWKAVKVIH